MTKNDKAFEWRETHARLCMLLEIPIRCEKCSAIMVFHQWPCVDEGTGDHLGDFMVWRCENCDHQIDVSECDA